MKHVKQLESVQIQVTAQVSALLSDRAELKIFRRVNLHWIFVGLQAPHTQFHYLIEHKKIIGKSQKKSKEGREKFHRVREKRKMIHLFSAV